MNTAVILGTLVDIVAILLIVFVTTAMIKRGKIE